MADNRDPVAPKAAGNGTKGKGKAPVAGPRATRVRVTPPPPAVAAPVAAAPVAVDPVVAAPAAATATVSAPAVDSSVAEAPVVDTPVASAVTTDPTPIAAKDEIMNETVTNIAEKAQDQARTMFAQANEQGRSSLEKGKKVAEDLAEFGKGNVEAIVESARIAAKGIESFSKDSAAFARARYESTAETVRALASVKSPTELMQLQADYFRSAFDAVVAEASRSTEASLKLAGEIAAPLQNRLAIATDKIKAAA